MKPANLRVVVSALPYVLALPLTQAPDAGWPLLFFLHGYDEGAPTPIEEALTRHGPLAIKSARMATTDFIVVAAQMPTQGDAWYGFAGAIQEVAEEVQAAHRVDADRLYLTGFSFGANGVFDLALLQPNRWAALWAVDPTRVPHDDPQRPIWLSSGAVSRYHARSFVHRLQLQTLGNTPPGDRVYLDQGRDHVGTATIAYQDERIYYWLLSKRLSIPAH